MDGEAGFILGSNWKKEIKKGWDNAYGSIH